jgi:two-component system chemotaxis response regulator CheB
MDGITFLRKIMSERPTPVIMCSSLTQKGTEMCMQALSSGAVEVIAKPTQGIKEFLQTEGNTLLAAVRSAAMAKVSHITIKERPLVEAKAMQGFERTALHTTTDRVIALGTSTGGTQALEEVLVDLPVTCAGIVIVQHMPEKFTAAFAKRLNSICQIEVKEAETGDRILIGRALIAPGGKHMQVTRSGAQYIVEVAPGPAVNRHCPSVDVLFNSVAKQVGRNAIGVIMTGMGDDGARGLLEMRNAGAMTFAQDEDSCVVFGMPKEAIKLNAAVHIIPLNTVATQLVKLADSTMTHKLGQQ